MDHTSELLDYISGNFGAGGDVALGAETSLFQDQLLDSLNMVELITFLESRFGIKVAPSEVSIDNLDTVSRMANFIQRKTGS